MRLSLSLLTASHEPGDAARRILTALVVSVLGAPGTVVSDSEGLKTVAVSDFDDEGIDGWERRDFSGRTFYEVVDTPQGSALKARADESASALYREVDVDLERTPCLSWQWRIAGVYEDNEGERRKAGDDYPARVYVVFEHGLGWWNLRAVNYVWSSHQPLGTTWRNAYTDKARMIAVASGPDEVGSWQYRSRDVVADYRRLFDGEPPGVKAVAVMSDSDDLGATSHAWYRAIRFQAAHNGNCG